MAAQSVLQSLLCATLQSVDHAMESVFDCFTFQERERDDQVVAVVTVHLFLFP